MEPEKKQPLSFGIIGGVQAPKPLDPDEDVNNPDNEMYTLIKTLDRINAEKKNTAQ